MREATYINAKTKDIFYIYHKINVGYFGDILLFSRPKQCVPPIIYSFRICLLVQSVMQKKLHGQNISGI